MNSNSTSSSSCTSSTQTSSEASTSSRWNCSTCTAENESNIFRCEICQNRKDHTVSIVPVNDGWECKRCTFQNSAQNETCEMCEAQALCIPSKICDDPCDLSDLESLSLSHASFQFELWFLCESTVIYSDIISDIPATLLVKHFIRLCRWMFGFQFPFVITDEKGLLYEWLQTSDIPRIQKKTLVKLFGWKMLKSSSSTPIRVCIQAPAFRCGHPDCQKMTSSQPCSFCLGFNLANSPPIPLHRAWDTNLDKWTSYSKEFQEEGQFLCKTLIGKK